MAFGLMLCWFERIWKICPSAARLRSGRPLPAPLTLRLSCLDYRTDSEMMSRREAGLWGLRPQGGRCARLRFDDTQFSSCFQARNLSQKLRKVQLR